MLTFIGNLFAARKLIEAFPDIPAFNFGDWTWGHSFDHEQRRRANR